jgi:hypothetical protein
VRLSFRLVSSLCLPSLLFIEVVDQVDPTPRQRFLRYVLAAAAEPFADLDDRLILIEEHRSLPLCREHAPLAVLRFFFGLEKSPSRRQSQCPVGHDLLGKRAPSRDVPR